MSEKGSSASFTLSEFFKTGKIDNDVTIQDKYIISTCLLYPERDAKEYEYIIREKAVVELDGRGVIECQREAKDLAFQSAVAHLQGSNVIMFPTPMATAVPAVSPAPTAPTAPVQKASSAPATPKAETVPPDSQKDMVQPPAAETPPSVPPVQARQVAAPPPADDHDADDLSPAEYTDGDGSGNAVRVDLTQLRPASSLIQEDAQEEGIEDSEAEAAKQYETARSTKITVCGKLHECFEWPAGRILDEKPQYIVELSQRYDGPKTNEKSALQTLYHEAVRRCNKAA